MLLADRLLLSGGGAITLIGTASAQATVGGATTLNIATPTGAQAGDLLVAYIATATGTPQTWTAPAGWTQWFMSVVGSSNVLLATAIHDGVTTTRSFAYSGSNKPSSGVIAAYRNTAVESVSAMGTSAVPSMSFKQNNSLCLVAASAASGNTSMGSSGFSLVYMDNDVTSPSIAMFSKSVGSGSTGTISVSVGQDGCIGIGLTPI